MTTNSVSKSVDSKPRWQCILFDLDGTLVNSEVLNFRAYRDLIPEIDMTESELIDHYCGVEMKPVIKDLEQRYQLNMPDDFEDTFRAHVRELYEAGLQAIPGIPQLLSALTVPIAVASNAPQKKIQHALAVTDLTQHFNDRLFSAYDINVWKPKPDLFLHAARQMGIAAEQCAVVEDSQPGVEAAVAAGMQVFHYCPHGRQADREGYTSIEQMSELADFLL